MFVPTDLTSHVCARVFLVLFGAVFEPFSGQFLNNVLAVKNDVLFKNHIFIGKLKAQA